MALIRCPNCGAEISDKAFFCRKCGVEINNAKPNASKKRIILACLVGSIVAGILGFYIFSSVNDARLAPDEEYVLGCIESLIHEEGNISLENDILYSKKDNGKTYVIVEFSSNSGRDVGYFLNQVYLGSDTDYEDMQSKRESGALMSGTMTKSEYTAMLDNMIEINAGRLEASTWNMRVELGLPGTEEWHLVSAKKIGKKLRIPYPQ